MSRRPAFSPGPEDWTIANQTYLVAALARVRALLEAHAPGAPARSPVTGPTLAASADSDSGGLPGLGCIASESLPAADWPHHAPPAIEHVVSTFGLSSFERAVLLCCAGVELHGEFSALFGRGPTFSQLLSRLPDAHWSALSPSSPLRMWRLIELAADGPLVLTPLRIDERILHFLAGVNAHDERMPGFVCALDASPPRSTTLRRAADRVAQRLADGAPAVQLCAADPGSGRCVAAHASHLLAAQAWSASAADLPQLPAERVQLARLWDREAMLRANLLVLEVEDGGEPARLAALLLDQLRSQVIVLSREPVGVRAMRPLARVDVPSLTRNERQMLWRSVLAPVAARLDGDIERLAEQFVLSEPAIDALAAGLGEIADPNAAGDDAVRRRVWDACRAQLRARIEGLAQPLEPRAHWDDIVLPDEQRATLDEIALHVRERATVYGRWGMDTGSARGLGVTALFAGPSGTGKTLAAEVLASELGLDLYRIDLSQVVSKYIGETEKNLARLFDAAEASGAVLLFDEADALFGKRSEVKDSHDRYANIEVSYLLQRMESYRGLAILATNLKSALDPAFLRRIRFVVEFPFPGPAERLAIWERAWPAATPLQNIDFERLASLDFAGGSIRSVALHAAFHAAGEHLPVGPQHVRRAARREFVKLGKPFTGLEDGQ